MFGRGLSDLAMTLAKQPEIFVELRGSVGSGAVD